MRRLGFSLVYAGLDQGNRLDWLNSGLINALLLGGGLLLMAFVVQELTTPRPWINLRYAARGNIPLLFLMITFFRFAILSTAFLIPQFLTVVQELPCDRGRRRSGVDRAATVPAGPDGVDAASFRRAATATRAWLYPDRCGLFHGGPTHAGLDWRRLPAVADRAGGGAVIAADIAGLVLPEASGTERGADVRRRAADRPPVWSGTGFGLRADLRAGARASVFESRWSACHCWFRGHRSATAGLRPRGERTIGWTACGERARTGLLAHAVQIEASVLAYIDGFMVIGFAMIGVLLMLLLLRDPPARAMPAK